MAPFLGATAPEFYFDADPDTAFDFDADPDPAFHSDADPDPAFQNDAVLFHADPDPDPQHYLLKRYCDEKFKG
jgi:hypothetical protein